MKGFKFKKNTHDFKHKRKRTVLNARNAQDFDRQNFFKNTHSSNVAYFYACFHEYFFMLRIMYIFLLEIFYLISCDSLCSETCIFFTHFCFRSPVVAIPWIQGSLGIPRTTWWRGWDETRIRQRWCRWIWQRRLERILLLHHGSCSIQSNIVKSL